MRKVVMALLTLCVTVAFSGCSGGSGNLKGFLAEADGVWYIHGNSSDEMLMISEEDGTWEYYTPEDDEGERALTDMGTITYNAEYKIYDFESENIIYPCEPVKDGILMFRNISFIAGEESCDLSKFDGEWYLDGDSDQDYYAFESGEWQYFQTSGQGNSSVDYGYLDYRGGDKQSLTAVRTNYDGSFAEFTIESNNEVKSDGRIYVRLEGAASADSNLGEAYEDSDNYDSESSDIGVILGAFYYLDGDSEMESLYFYSDNTVDFDSPGLETMEGVYSVEGDNLTITFGDEIIELTIQDAGETLVDAQDYRFLYAE